MIIDVTQVGEGEEELSENVGYRKPHIAKQPMDGTRKSRVDRRTLFVGLAVALLFVGGGIYAWQGSQLKGSIGQAVQTVHLESSLPSTEPESGNQDARVAANEVVRRNTTSISRAAKPLLEVAAPNGGEAFCLGDTFDISWRSQGVRQVAVELRGEQATYYLGVASAAGAISTKNIALPKAGTYKVAVQSAAQPDIQDTSDAFFAIQDCAE